MHYFVDIQASSDSFYFFFLQCALDVYFLQITGIGKQIKVQFFGDCTVAKVGRHCILPFNSNIDVTKHFPRRGYVKAMQEALIEGISSMKRSIAAVDQFTEKSNNAVKVERAVTSVTHIENPSIRNCATHSQSATNAENKSIITRNKTNTQKTTQNKIKIESSVRRSKRLRKKNIA